MNQVLYFKFQKLFFYAVAVVMAVQLIYFSVGYGYMHALLLFLFITLIDVYKPTYRLMKEELIMLGLFTFITLTLFLEPVFGITSGYVYYVSLMVGALAILPFVKRFNGLKLILKSKKK